MVKKMEINQLNRWNLEIPLDIKDYQLPA